MLVTGKYIIKWTYHSNNKYTTCSIYNKENVLVLEGEIKKHPNDNHNKEIARKKSLKRAMKYDDNTIFTKKVNLTKEERKNIWETYRLMSKTPKW